MRINKIILNNFGCYESENTFNIKKSDYENITLVGGKNGSGKTTLFTAIKVCLYGYKSMGYKNFGSYYTRAITKLINNNAKLLRPTRSYINLEIELNNQQGIDIYNLKREWFLDECLTEYFYVSKNGEELSNQEVFDFEKYLLSLIPPDLFNLFFFDGEQIASYFLEGRNNKRIKSAFLLLCGYDIFEIMRANFKRISEKDNNVSTYLNEYILLKNEFEQTQENLNNLLDQKNKCTEDIQNCEADIIAIEKHYRSNGGVTDDEWSNKFDLLKKEEKKRVEYNLLFKKISNEIIPFLILQKELKKIKKQITAENKAMKYKLFCDVIDNKQINCKINNKEEIKKIASEIYGYDNDPILNLSLEQNTLVVSQINKILAFNKDEVKDLKKSIETSIKLSAKIRNDINQSSVSILNDYIESKSKLFENKSHLLETQVKLNSEISLCRNQLEEYESKLKNAKNKLEKEIKQGSINDISTKAIMTIDMLKDILYRKEIEKVESCFRNIMQKLIRKERFIDDIYIDDEFHIHLYKKERMDVSMLLEILTTSSDTRIVSILGNKAIKELYDAFCVNNISRLVDCMRKCELVEISLSIEIDKTTMSNGEKQIFIMALYYALISLCKHDLPFIIDTPFARIDTEHRYNISKYFFNELKGQIFILSTNEEINNDHIDILKNKIATTFLLENTDNQKTIVIQDEYFKE